MYCTCSDNSASQPKASNTTYGIYKLVQIQHKSKCEREVQDFEGRIGWEGDQCMVGGRENREGGRDSQMPILRSLL